MAEWISVKDRLPEKLQTVIVNRCGFRFECVMEDGTWINDDIFNTPVKYWMPLPEPPKPIPPSR